MEDGQYIKIRKGSTDTAVTNAANNPEKTTDRKHFTAEAKEVHVWRSS